MQARDILGLLAGSAVVLTGAAAVAQSDAKARVDAAKAAGVVGEQADGFLGFVTGAADPALKAAVAEINAGRAQVYREAAAKNGVSPEAAGASAFNTVVREKLKPGEYYKPAGGGWIRK
ncbi:MAG TPA: YdbL family protein [Phenylobacterium sp.]|uniref:YdbL family protein n=1 Tax=Phenylobacterium sp. TaxID=1871053 RepID=UPI002BF23ED1|nr:YdbL family protein [Phenylobacterium sp.]HSV03754.1 YdbL family protein [Phenylobacterium sp.]